MGKKTVVRRFTSTASAIDVIKHKRLTLLNPDNWDDRNDALLIGRYK